MRRKPRKRTNTTNNNNKGDKGQKTSDKDAWRAELDATSINDDRWWCIATMMVETTTEHSRYVSLLDAAAEDGKCTAHVRYLSHRKATTAVKTLAEGDPEKCPVAQRICHYANALLLSENNGDLSAWLMARVVKYLIYRAKIEHVDGGSARWLDRDDPGIDASSRSEAVAGRAGKRGNRAARASGDGKGSAEESTALPNEPDLYVVLSGFHDPDLPAELVSVGVPLTCIFEVEPPDREARVAEEPTLAAEAGLVEEDYRAKENELLDFWAVTNRRFSDPSTYPAYANIAVLTFRPPASLPRSFGAAEKRSLIRDMQDEMSRTLRRLHRLHRRHADYLASMKLERRIVGTRRREPTDNGIYEDALRDLPNDCIDAPFVLCAMLLQVEADLAGSPDLLNADLPRDADTAGDTSTTNHERSGFVRAVRGKLELLDREHELDEPTDRSPRPSDIELVLHGDTLSAVTRHLDRHKSVNLVDGVLRILQEPRITSIWRDHEAPARPRAEMYARQLDGIARMFDRAVSREEVAHYLHLLTLDRLIFGGNEREGKATRRTTRDEAPSEYARPTTSSSSSRRPRSASDSTTTSLSTVTSGLRERSGSDTAIDYEKTAAVEWPLLFALTDVRETLLPGYLYRNVFERRSYERPTIEEYEDVELLPRRVFPQVARECFQSFDRFAARYFEPTDSVLLYFSNNNGTDAPAEETTRVARLSSIPTPVRFRDFCKYVAQEEEEKKEEDWAKREKTCQSDPTGRFMKEPAVVEDDAIIFDDECFVLPDSLKARRLRRPPAGREKISETSVSREGDVAGQRDEMTGQKRDDGSPMTADIAEDGRADVRVTSGKTSMTGKKSKINDGETSVAKKILSPRCAEDDARDGDERRDSVVGYDLGRVRVQVSHRGESFFLRDDVAVRIEVDDWLYADFHLRVAVVLRDCTLRLSGGEADRHRPPDAFHLTTRRRGIVLAFRRHRQSVAAAENPSSDRPRQNLAFDFCASWPSGLLIEPTIEDAGKNPFCIRQSYVSKCPARAGATREVRRNFLGNGTVLKHLADNTVVILRPNGVIVTCTDFDKPRSRESTTDAVVVHRTTVKTELTARRSNSEQSVERGEEERVMDPEESIVQSSKRDRAKTPAGERSNGDDSLITRVSGVGEVLRYSVVNYDGRSYEVLNDQVVSEHDRLLVRTASDYRVNEIFTRRADGTDMLFRFNGELVVTFPDGTRIITGCTIEQQPVICEWSEEELQRYFDAEERGSASSAADDGEFPDREDPPAAASRVDHRPTARGSIAADDGFVSILLTFRTEHKDYATVSYDQSAVTCTLSMPDDLRVSISGRGHYEVSMGAEVNLKTRDDDAVLTKQCATCGGRSTSTFEFGESGDAAPRTILMTVDILGNLLEVKSDGATRYRRADQHDRVLPERGEDSSNEEEEEDDDGEEEEEQEEEEEEEEKGAEVGNSEARFRCKHQRYCEKLEFPARSQYRIFAMNRDLTACEYLHRSVRREQEVAAVFGDGTSMIQYPISRRPELRRLITFVPVEPELGSKEISCQYWVTSGERTDYGGIELRPSTYSFPYDWLFPYPGEGGRGVSSAKRTRNEVSARQNEQPLPKLLRVRVFFGIKEAGASVLIDIQRAMGRYWISVFRDGDKCRLFYASGSGRPGEVENDYESSEENGLPLRELALGLKRSIDAQTYVGGLQVKLIKVGAAEARRQPTTDRLAKLLRQRASENVEYEWYKQCMRKRIVPPYFRYIDDSYYPLPPRDPVDEVASVSKNHSLVAANRNELINP